VANRAIFGIQPGAQVNLGLILGCHPASAQEPKAEQGQHNQPNIAKIAQGWHDHLI
jgi:hypothetical protein